MSIGEVLALLRSDFPDVTISKIRFLEDQGLVEPDRTPSGYRKFGHADVERLRFVLGVQRDHYLPLRVIRDHLDALDRGQEPRPLPGGHHDHDPDPGPGDDPVRAVRDPDREPAPGSRLDREALLAASGASQDLLERLESFGLIGARAGTGDYDADDAAVARAAAGLAAFGVEPRHLRLFRSAADREAALVEQVVAPLRRRRGPQAPGRARETAREMAALCVDLHTALVRSAVDRRPT